MIDLPGISTFAVVLNDDRFAIAAGISVLAGLVREFSGFGSALIYVPLIAAVYDPRVAAATLLLIDFVSGFPFAIAAFPYCNWREVVPITIAAMIAVPFGTMALLFIDATILRWIVAAVVLIAVSIIAAGVRYRKPHTGSVTAAVGFASGFFGGAFQMDGPPVVIYWLGGANVASVVRANLMVFIVLNGATMCIAYLISGLLTSEVIVLSVLLGLPFITAMRFGASFFQLVSEQGYRRFAYLIIAASAIVSLPVFDGLIR
jgi:uncharacterized protein